MAHAWLMGAISRKRDRQSDLTDPPEPKAPEGFLFSVSQGSFEISRRKPERETRIPGLAPERRVPKRAGPVGGNEAMSRTPMTERTALAVRNSGASFTRRA